jgi:tetratricopeptide (TPR) repeat protein
MAVTGRREEKCVAHPDRPAAVRCAACHKPVCAACAVSTAEGQFCSHECAKRTADFRASDRTLKRPGAGVGGIVKIIVWLIVILVALCVVNRYFYKIPAIGDYLWSGHNESKPPAKNDHSDETGGIASQASAVLTQLSQSAAVNSAQKQYESGQGEQAMETLTKAGMGDSEIGRRVRDVIAAKAKANDASQTGRFDEAKAAWEKILRLEAAQTNAYVQEAKRNLDGLPAKIKEYAQQLVRQADDLAGNDKKEYRKARDNYVAALKLDPANKGANDGLARLAKSATFDFNTASNLPRDTLDQVNAVLQKLLSVQDRLRDDDRRSRRVRDEIEEVQGIKAKLEAQGGQKGP